MRTLALLGLTVLVLVWLLRSLLPGSAGKYQVTEIPSQGRNLFFHALNDKGQAAGSVRGQGQERAIVWDANAGIRRLATPQRYSSLAMDINSSGQVCGEVRDPNSKPVACFWDSDGRRYDIGTLGGRASIAQKLNGKGQVVGWSQTSGGTVHAFLWTKDQGIIDLDTRGAMHSFAVGINDYGQVAGYLGTDSEKRHVFVWQEDTGMVEIHDELKGIESVAGGINSSGQIIGQYLTAENLWRAFAWDRNRGFRYLRIVSERDYGCAPLAISDCGQGVVATHEKRVKRFGFVFSPARSLSFLLDRNLRRLYLHKALPFETDHFIAYDMNDKGQIIASARVSGTTKWYLMTPAD